jgi:hypothetical protein
VATVNGDAIFTDEGKTAGGCPLQARITYCPR